MHAQTIKCVFNRIGMPKLLGLVKFRLTNFKKFSNTQEFCVLGLLWQIPYLHLAVCFGFWFLPSLLSDSFLLI